MDFKYVPYLVEGRQVYQLSCVDHHSSWRLIRDYPNKNEAAVLAFLDELLAVCPFPILEIQTDNDAAFTDKFSSGRNEPSGLHAMDRWCKKHFVHHKLIPVGQKELNGKVENTHKFDDREFFSQIQCLNLTSLRMQTDLYNNRWNEKRKTKTLGWKTPWEVILESYVRSIAYLLVLGERYNFEAEIERHLDQFREPEQAPQMEKPGPPPKPKKLTAFDRYLQYLDWETKQRIKSVLVPLAMSLPISLYLWGFTKGMNLELR